MKTNGTKLVAALLAIGSGFAVAPLSAVEPAGVTQSVTVDLRDVDPATAEGARVVYRRIEAAARKVAGVEPATRELLQHAYWQANVDHAVAQAVQHLSSAGVNLRRNNPTQSAEQAAGRLPTGRL